jgi:hypothetical protein
MVVRAPALSPSNLMMIEYVFFRKKLELPSMRAITTAICSPAPHQSAAVRGEVS